MHARTRRQNVKTEKWKRNRGAAQENTNQTQKVANVWPSSAHHLLQEFFFNHHKIILLLVATRRRWLLLRVHDQLKQLGASNEGKLEDGKTQKKSQHHRHQGRWRKVSVDTKWPSRSSRESNKNEKNFKTATTNEFLCDSARVNDLCNLLLLHRDSLCARQIKNCGRPCSACLPPLSLADSFDEETTRKCECACVRLKIESVLTYGQQHCARRAQKGTKIAASVSTKYGQSQSTTTNGPRPRLARSFTPKNKIIRMQRRVFVPLGSRSERRAATTAIQEVGQEKILPAVNSRESSLPCVGWVDFFLC